MPSSTKELETTSYQLHKVHCRLLDHYNWQCDIWIWQRRRRCL